MLGVTFVAPDGHLASLAAIGTVDHVGARQRSEAVELAESLDIKIDEAELIKTNSTGLTIYNPQNLAERIKSMKNKTVTREQKIALRKQYEAMN